MYGAGFSMRLFSCSRRGFVFTIAIHISPIYTLQRPARTQAQVYRVLCSAKVVESLVDEDEKKQTIATARVDTL